jgi:hypothetical protein
MASQVLPITNPAGTVLPQLGSEKAAFQSEGTPVQSLGLGLCCKRRGSGAQGTAAANHAAAAAAATALSCL